MSKYDAIIIGAGSAGCVLASRLSEDPNFNVLLIEAGPRDSSPLFHMPGGTLLLLKDQSPYNWAFETEPEKNLNDRPLFWPKGRVLGGSSSINGMIYIRGNAADYDDWAKAGATGWGFDDILPYFKMLESSQIGDEQLRGRDGPIQVEQLGAESVLGEAFCKAGVALGHPRTLDFNGAQQEGVGLYEFTISKGRRQSTASTYLKPAKDRPNLTVMVESTVSRILFDGKNAIGVELLTKDGPKQFHGAEIILSAGAVGSPQILMLSGIGPQVHLAEHGIDIVHANENVGQNMQDHIVVSPVYECTQPITLYSSTKPLGMVKSALSYLLFKSGPAASIGCDAGAFLKTKEQLEQPDIQAHFMSGYFIDGGRVPMDRHGFMAHVGPIRPESRGEIRLKSNDPMAHPAIRPNHLSAEGDMEIMRDGFKMIRQLFLSSAFDAYRGEEMRPGKDVQSDDEIDDYIRDKCQSVYHVCGTCKMGTAKDAVVDSDLNVIGVTNLRVVDASVMPNIISGNTNAPTIMIAEKAADIIKRSRAN